MRVLRIGLVTGLVFASLSLSVPDVSRAAAGDIGVEGPSYAGASADPTGEKPESKTWFNDGSWWGSLWDTASSRYEIFRLNTSNQTWTSTNVPLDTRSNSRADTLWDGTHLYVASHVFSATPATGYPSNLYRFSYNATSDTYTLDATWPQQINNVRSETLVIDKDSTGQLWATWVQNAAADGLRRVHVNRTADNSDSGWGTPFVVPGNTNHTRVSSDDISSLIAFGPGKIGVFWSNQRVSPKTFNFIVHDDNAADLTWGASVAIGGGTNFGDDHINLKSLSTDGSGRIFALVKTSNTQASQPLIVLLTRSSAGAWSQSTVWTKGNNMTRPVVLLDTSNSRVHAFASTESGGAVYHKTATFSNLSFPTGLGTIVMQDASQNDINNVTSGKGNLTSTTGLLVLASNQTTQRYWHHYESLGGGGGNVTPVCNTRSLTVTQDTSGGDVAPSCTDTDGPSALTYNIATQGPKGVATVTGGPGTWQLHYTPNAGQSGSDSFTYTAYDGADTSAPATVNVTITPTGGNVAPVCSARSMTVPQDGSGDVAPSCTDSDGPTALTYNIATQGPKGVATVTGGPGTWQLHYVPNAGQSGPDSFTYTAYDGADTSAPATVNVTITPTGGGGGATATPDADTYVRSDNQAAAFGSENTLRSRGGGTLLINSYLRFTIANVGATSSSEVLRLYVSDVSVDGGKLYQVANNTWTESMVYTGQPTLGPLIVDLGALPATGYVDIPVGSYVNGDGVYSFAIIGENNDVAMFNSREGLNDPQLVVTP
jgi:Big-like domain-containing protein